VRWREQLDRAASLLELTFTLAEQTRRTFTV
jgi:hypothetical protein